ncbi:hypothetical protein JTE90_015862 [Oedothorax gibbosus]|uniref:TPX2 central domain-containing protein n=1 Tax=Oedothorax gibbosus TaxID=931172 RepID=A0AAV6VWM0_9ARAC|nr:hypothetical protein JTE90_015862 [Oedothorax gibbosus]
MEMDDMDMLPMSQAFSNGSENGSKILLCASDEINGIHIGETCNGTKKISKYSEISNNVEDGKLTVLQKLPAQTSEPNKDKFMRNTPLTVKSKFSKFFKAPSFKSPFKSKFEEKENTDKECKQNSLSEKNLSKIGKMPSAKSILSASNTKGSMTLTTKLSIKTPLNKSSIGNVLIGSEKKTVKVSQDVAKQKPQTFDTPLKRMSLAKFQPPSNGKTPLGKSYSLRAKTPNTGTNIRRSSSFQTQHAENAYQLKKERSFLMESRPTHFNSRMSLAQTQPIGNKLRFETPTKLGPFLPKTSTANPTAFGTPFTSKAKFSSKELQSCNPPFGSAIRPIKVPNQNVPEVVGLKRPASTTSKSRFTSRLELPSPLPKMLNDNLSRRLFPDYSTPLKRRV